MSFSELQLLHTQTCLAEADLQLGMAPDLGCGQCGHPDLAGGGVLYSDKLSMDKQVDSMNVLAFLQGSPHVCLASIKLS